MVAVEQAVGEFLNDVPGVGVFSFGDLGAQDLDYLLLLDGQSVEVFTDLLAVLVVPEQLVEGLTRWQYRSSSLPLSHTRTLRLTRHEDL